MPRFLEHLGSCWTILLLSSPLVNFSSAAGQRKFSHNSFDDHTDGETSEVHLARKLRYTAKNWTKSVMPTAEDGKDWCEYIHATPEPSIIFYNRIPKAGGSTMQQLASTVISSNRDMVYYATEQPQWGGDYVNNSTRLSVLTDLLNKQISEHLSLSYKTLFFDGHIGWFPLDPSLIHGANSIEYTQITRQCDSRIASEWNYRLHHHRDVATAIRENRIEEYTENFLGVDYAHKGKCLHSALCIKRSPGFQKAMGVSGHDVSIVYIAGHFCTNRDVKQHNATIIQKYCDPYSKDRNLLDIARGRLLDVRNGYQSFGLTEAMAEYVEMLECVYPSIFAGSSKSAREGHYDTNVHVVEDALYSEALKEAAVDACKRENPEAVELYEYAQALFWERYWHMKNNTESCCRVPR